MPIIKSAIKKMRQDKKREQANRAKIAAVKTVLKELTKKPTNETLSKAFSVLDKAAKKGLLPKGRVNRKKARLSKLLVGKSKVVTKPAVRKKASSKKSSK